MAATHCVSLFLPNTVEFPKPGSEEDDFPPSCSPPRPFKHIRHASAFELSRRSDGEDSPFSLTKPQYSPASAMINTDDIFGQTKDGRNPHKLHFARPGDPRSLVRSDAETVEWGQDNRFDQPRSRAAPLPSASILDFTRPVEDFTNRRRPARGPAEETTFKASGSGLSRTLTTHSSNSDCYESRKWVVMPTVQGNGALQNAMRDSIRDSENEISWIGTLGCPTDTFSQDKRAEIADHLGNEYQEGVVFLSDKDLDGHYTHYCKTILWPILHYQVPDQPNSKAYAEHSWEFYRNVNQAFADKVVSSYKRGDTIWVHDYHLLLVPGMIRKQLPDAQIGFFLHVPFPSSEVFRCLSTRNQLLEGMLGANLVAFQTDEYANHFLQTCSRLLTVEATGDGVQLEDHFVNVTHQPIGINASAIQDLRYSGGVADAIKTMKERCGDKKIIFARDKFDNIHGIRQKLLAYEVFLNKYPEWKDRVVLVQIATSKGKDADFVTKVSDVCDRIMSTHDSLGSQPLIFIKQDLTFEQYLALISIADVLMISALREGMNLSPHEYISCQDGVLTDKKHGALIISEFTGSAALFREGQVAVNPWDNEMSAKAIKAALEMTPMEKEARWKKMYDVVQKRSGRCWAEELKKTLARVHEAQSQTASNSVPRLSITQLSEKYKQAERRVFLIDYDGTLSPHRTAQGISLSSPYRVIDTLNDLMSDSRNIVYIMSGRRQLELESIFRTATGLGLIAENGCFIRAYGAATGDWHPSIDLDNVKLWMKDVKNILQYYRERMDGSQFDERRCSLVFRYDRVEDQEAALRLAGDCADQINASCRGRNVQAVPVHKAVLIEPTDFSKATAAELIFNKLCGPKSGQETGTMDQKENPPIDQETQSSPSVSTPEFLMVVGDDREDEVVFRWANALHSQSHGPIKEVFTVSVGKRNTDAQTTLANGCSGLLTVLQKLGKISIDEVAKEALKNYGQ